MTDPALMHRIMSGARDNIRGMYEGVASLPLPDDMYSEESQNMAQGGIVAFRNLGGVDSTKNPDATMTADEANYRNASDNTAFARALQYAGAAATDLLTMPGQLAFQNGTITPKYETEGLFPRTGNVENVAADKNKNYGDIMAAAAAQKLAAPTTNFDLMNPWANVGKNPAGVSTGVPTAAPTASTPAASTPAASTPAASTPAAPAARTISKPAADPYTSQLELLKQQSEDAGKMITDATRTREKVLTSQEYANQDIADQNAFLKAHKMPTAEESLNDKVKRLSEQGAQARKDRDVDRWMAAAQGFFAMGAGQSRYALQNISAGLGIGTKELQTIEKDYRKGEQLRADKTELLNEAARQETLGNYEKGARLRKEAQTRNDKLDDNQLKVGMHLQNNANTVMGHVISQHGIAEARRSAEKARLSASADALAARTDAAAAALEVKKQFNQDTVLQHKILGLNTVMKSYEVQQDHLSKSPEGMNYALMKPKEKIAYLKTPEGQAYKAKADDIASRLNQTSEQLTQLLLGKGTSDPAIAVAAEVANRKLIPKSK